MVPRQMIIPSFQSKNSEKLAGRDWSSILVSGNDPTTGQIQASKIETDGLTAMEIAADAVGTSEISDKSIEKADLSDALLDEIIPAGTIMAFGGVNAKVPSGWLLCHGQSVPQASYPRLFEAIEKTWGSGNIASHFNLPDLRGRFLRGKANGTNRDPDRDSRTESKTGGKTGDEVGSIQDDAFVSHSHVQHDKTLVSIGPTRIADGGSTYELGSNTAVSTQSAGGSETRPKNAYVNYIIKF